MHQLEVVSDKPEEKSAMLLTLRRPRAHRSLARCSTREFGLLGTLLRSANQIWRMTNRHWRILESICIAASLLKRTFAFHCFLRPVIPNPQAKLIAAAGLSDR